MQGAWDWRDRLGHVLWLGGPPDAGKSTVAMALADKFDVAIYRQDANEMEHLKRAADDAFPLNADVYRRATDDEAGFFQRWVDDEPRTLMEEARATWIERLPMICEDLAALGGQRPVIVEGPGLFPEAILPLVSRPSQALWLVPTEAFKRVSHASRDKSSWRHMTNDPERAIRHHIERDLLLAETYRDSLRDHDLPWIEVDGFTDIASVSDRVAAHFGLT